MTQAPHRPPAYLQPRPKAAPTFSSTSLSAVAATPTPELSRSPPQSRQSSPSRRPAPTDTSDKATAALIRRVLCPRGHAGSAEPRPIDELLPPLTSSNETDLQLYAIIAIVVKEFVYTWYGKITPDQVFVEEVVRLFAHCTRALESRLRGVDLEGLILDEIPELLESHVVAYRVSHHSLHPPPLTTDPRKLYHTLHPHPALSPVPDLGLTQTVTDQRNNEAAYRQLLVQGALAVLLPTEDLENAYLRTLVADVIGEMILGNGVGGKACEGWLIWEGITNLVEKVKGRLEPKATGGEVEADTRSRLEKFGLLEEKSDKVEPRSQRSQLSSRSTAAEMFWRILQYGYLVFIALRFVLLGLFTASSQASRASGVAQTSMSPPSEFSDTQAHRRPMISSRIFSLISCLVDASRRMPWLAGSLSLLQYEVVAGPGRVGDTDGMLDKFLRTLITTHILTPSLLPPVLLSLRTSLFPSNALAPARTIPFPGQQAAIRRACANSILSLLPPVVAQRYFNTKDEGVMEKETEDLLDVFGDAYCNKHVVYGIAELVLVRLMPELAEKGVRELMEARLGEGWDS